MKTASNNDTNVLADIKRLNKKVGTLENNKKELEANLHKSEDKFRKLSESHQLLENDISKRKKAEIALRESESRFRLAFYTCPDSISINRMSDGLYVEINHGFTKITGYSEKDVIGKTSTELNIWADPSDRQRIVDGLKSNGLVENLEALFQKKDGTISTGLMSASAMLWLEQPAEIMSIRDITERKKTEKELQEYRDDLQEKVKDATKELKAKNKELRSYNDLFVGREFRIKDLRDEVKRLTDELEALKKQT